MDVALSVIIAAFNEERHLAECIKSLKLGEHPDWEAIVINDASTDKTAKVMALFAAKLPNLRCRSLDYNVGQGSARNFGMMLATGRRITFLDADDYVDADKLASSLAKAERSGVDILVSGHTRLYDDGPVLTSLPDGEYSGPAAACALLARAFGSYGACFKIYTREHLIRQACLFVARFYYEDVAFGLQAFFSAPKVATESNAYYMYRCNEPSTTRQRFVTPLHLLSSAKVYFDIAQFIKTKPPLPAFKAALDAACDIMLADHFSRMLPAIQQGMHKTSLETYHTFLYFMSCHESAFSSAILHAVREYEAGRI
jgi:glycosyltransferase involved in cell wall biosynthesis